MRGVKESTVYEQMKLIDKLLTKAMRDPQVTPEQRDELRRASLIQHRVMLAHMPKRLPMDPATLPKGARLQAFAPVSGLCRGWLLEREDEEVANA